MFVTPLLVMLGAVSCPAGQSVTPDTAGQCCWGGQVWSKLQNRCVGVPQCPSGSIAQGETCVVSCPAGQTASEDTAGHCCWPSQVWANSRGVCVGVPQCPAGLTASGETCVQAAQPPPTQYAQPPPTQYAQPPPTQYAQPPPTQYAQPPPPPQYPAQPQQAQPQQYPPGAPNVSAPQSVLLQARLTDLKAKQASTNFVGAVVGVVVGPPTIALSIFLLGISSKESDVVWSSVLLVCGVALTIAGIVEFPVTAARKARLGREIRETEAELRKVQAQSSWLVAPPIPGLLASFSTPVLRF